KIGLSCGYIFGFYGKYGDFPALMDSARARLNTAQASKRPCRKTGSEHAGLTPIAVILFSPSQLSVSLLHLGHSGGRSFSLTRPVPAYAPLRYSASLVNNAQAIRASLFAIATVAIFFPRRCSSFT